MIYPSRVTSVGQTAWLDTEGSKTMTVYLVGSLDGEPITFAPKQGLYSDNTPWMKGYPPKGMQIDDVFIMQSSLQDFVASMMYVRAALNTMTEKTRLVIPFYPGARQDHPSTIGDVLGTKGFVTQWVNELEPFFAEIVVFDMHSERLNPRRLRNITPAEIIAANPGFNPTPGYYDTIIAPDHGATARAEEVGALFHTPVIVADKIRDLSNGRITHYEIDTSQTEMKKVLVVDDICDGGATFEILADSLPIGTERHLFVTHGLFSRGTDNLLSWYDRIITTNSVYRESGHKRISVIDLFPGVSFNV
jgi:ribose-phosphate pyrophosphokinase